ncbi:MAG: hypothetical protein IKV15_03680 [Bacteroidaceae bacterium]|nr:hypothetical protein [Bacteroidaceae bacterium]
MILLCLSSDWVAIIVDIIIGIGVAYILAYIVPMKLNNNRSLKDFYINELVEIKSDYNDFCKSMALGKSDATTIKTNFKQLSLRLDAFQHAAKQNIGLDFNILIHLTKMQLLITSSQEMNEQFRKKTIIFSSKTQNGIWSNLNLFNVNLMSAIAAINNNNLKAVKVK